MEVHKKLTKTLISTLSTLGYRVMGEVHEGLRAKGDWFEIVSVSRSSDCAGGYCVEGRRVGNKTTSRIALTWFTGNFGVEKKETTNPQN